jgi:hypothetical protein
MPSHRRGEEVNADTRNPSLFETKLTRSPGGKIDDAVGKIRMTTAGGGATTTAGGQ